MKVAGVAVLVAIALGASACGGGRAAGSPASSVPSGPAGEGAKVLTSTGLILGGRLRCTATVSRSVQAGAPLGLTFAVRNVSDKPVKVSLAFGGLWFVLRSPDGTTYDTRVPLRNEILPAYFPTPLAPGATRTEALGNTLHVRWRGPLEVTPGCEKTALPALRVGVAAPGPPPDRRTAVDDVVAASGHLLDSCRPQEPGVPVNGQIDAPDGSAPPMSASCSVSLRDEGNFLVAQALIASPPGGYVQVEQPYERIALHHASPYEAAVWDFVVTKDGTTPVAAAEEDATKPANRMATDWSLNGSDWKWAGDGRCGGSGGGGGGANPTIEFVSVCPS